MKAMRLPRLVLQSLLLLVLQFLLACAPSVRAAEVLVPAGSVWKYFDQGAVPGPDWSQPGFPDGGWSAGPAQLGYGDGDEATVVGSGPNPAARFVTTYFRKTFSVTNTASVGALLLRVLRDDGAAVYLNGVEVFRSNLPPGPLGNDTLATISVGGAEETTQFIPVMLSSVLLHEGVNTLAAEVHQVNVTSSDLSFDLELLAAGSPPSTNRPPSVAVTRPADGLVVAGPTNLLVTASANDPEGFYSVQTVEFFANGASIGLTTNLPTMDPIGPFRVNWQNIQPGAYTLLAVATDDHAAKGTSAPVHITVEGPPPAGEEELHLVGIYSGAAAGGGAVHNHELGDATVSVNRPGRRVSLFLASYEPTRWHVAVGAGTTMERVFISSYYASTVDGISASVPVTTLNVGYAYSLESSGYYQLLPRVCDATGQEIASFHGSYAAPYPTPFVVDAVQNDPRLHCNYPQPETNNLPALNFRLAFYNSGSGISFQDYTTTGPVGSMDLLPGEYSVPDEGGRYFYTADPHYVLQIDSQTGNVRNLELPANVPELSWPMGAAYDSLRQRVLLVSQGGEGFLYAYAPTQDTWSVVTSMNNLDLDAIVYHAATDKLFGIGSGPVLLQMSADGAQQRSIRLPVLPWQLGPGGMRSELVSVGDYLFWLIGPRYFWDSNQETRMYLIDPRTGEVRLTYRRGPPPPNRPPVVTLTSPMTGSVFGAEATVPLAATVADPDGRIESVEFLLNGDSLGNASGPFDTAQGTWTMQVSGLEPGTYDFTVIAEDNSGGTGTSSTPITFTVLPAPDADGDGVSDAHDQCPNTPPGTVVNERGCSLAQLCPCDGGWRNHAEYVRCVVDHAWKFYRAELINADQRRAAIRAAIRSNCGRQPNAAEAMQLHLLPLSPVECQLGGLQFVVSGDAVGECVVESSTDLVHWTTVQTLAADAMGNEIACPHPTSEPARFYRVRAVP